mmetsp:Transcript_47336/g.111455  ORF Transcript_47336/g.111455 Transcript_47336/m.111455 type:complete len:250 (-) Transcript_47336:203-952(-)
MIAHLCHSELMSREYHNGLCKKLRGGTLPPPPVQSESEDERAETDHEEGEGEEDGNEVDERAVGAGGRGTGGVRGVGSPRDISVGPLETGCVVVVVVAEGPTSRILCDPCELHRSKCRYIRRHHRRNTSHHRYDLCPKIPLSVRGGWRGCGARWLCRGDERCRGPHVVAAAPGDGEHGGEMDEAAAIARGPASRGCLEDPAHTVAGYPHVVAPECCSVVACVLSPPRCRCPNPRRHHHGGVRGRGMEAT